MTLSCFQCCTAQPHPPSWRQAIMDSPVALAEWVCNRFRDRSKEPCVLGDSHSPPHRLRKSTSLAVFCVPVAGNQSTATWNYGEIILVMFCPNCSTGICHKLRECDEITALER